MTKKAKRGLLICRLLHLLFFWCPLVVYTILGFVQGTAVVDKITLSCTLLIVLVLSLVSLVNKVALRSKLWVLLIGLWACLDTFMQPLILIATTQVIDELILSPLVSYYKTKVQINKELDKRGC
jgi:hypothetical protein